jgi:prepilin-type N-terminal cleavage/methylation domain-containing protein
MSDQMSEDKKMVKESKNEKGFSLIEVLVGITLVAVALVGLAELFTLSVLNNLRSSEISNATFLAQQEVEHVRTLLTNELSAFPAITDQQIDVNGDGTVDFRRITQVTSVTSGYDIRVLVFPRKQLSVAQATLIASPTLYQVKAQIDTIVTR